VIIKSRKIPLSLQVRRILRPRMPFTDRELKQLESDEKGYQGESLFDDIIAGSPASTYLHLNDLMLSSHNNTFQVDSLIFSPHKISLFEVKNFGGEFYIEGEQWFLQSGKEIKNPIPQLRRSRDLLRPLVQTLGVHLPIEAYVIFVNPEFTLFQASSQLPIILPTQINSFMKKFTPVSMESNKSLIDAAKKLASHHDDNSPYYKSHMPSFDFDNIKKGATCFRCGSLSVHLCGRSVECDVCGFKENLHNATLRAIDEHKLLFPGRLITVSSINEWTGFNMNRLRLQRILVNHLTMTGSGKTVFYR
jgi:ribosomal protein L37E